MEDNEMRFSFLCKPRVILIFIIMTDFPFKIQDMLNEYSDIIVDDLPNEFSFVRSICHHIDLIPGESLPNKVGDPSRE